MNFKNIKSNQIILFVVALMLVSAGYLSYSMRGTLFLVTLFQKMRYLVSEMLG